MDNNNNTTKIYKGYSKQREKNIKYWENRAVNNYLAGEKDALQIAKELKANYLRCIKEIENKINQFYGKYASENKISLAEAKKLLNRKELKDFKSNINDILAMGKKENFNEDQMRKFKQLYAKTKISRLDELQANIQWELDKLTNNSYEKVTDLLENTYEDGYYRTVYDVEQFKGFSSSFTGINKQAIEKAISTKYLSANYSQRLWQNESNLITTLQQEIPRGLTLGYNPRKLAKLTSNKLNSNYNNTVRLIRTEYSKILNDATLDGYKAAGIDRYQILSALDSRTCNDCGEFDNEIIPIKEGQVGVNLPPFHPNCRCTTIPYFEPDEFDDINATAFNYKLGLKVPLNTSYSDWKEYLNPTKNKEVIYENKDALKTATTDVDKWMNSLSKPEMDALWNYSWKEYGDSAVANFEDINDYLRNIAISDVGEERIKNAIGLIDSAIDKFKLDKNIVVYRGASTPTLIKQVIGEKKWTRVEDVLSNYLKGKKISNESFISTSTSEEEALKFGSDALLRINVPAGTKGAYIDKISQIPMEKEFLLGRNTQFKINRIKWNAKADRFIIYCDLVKQ